MKLDRNHARYVARHFRAGRGRLWPWVTDHEMLIDAEVLDCLREAHAANRKNPVNIVVGPLTIAEILAFRQVLVEELTKIGFTLTALSEKAQQK